MKITVATDLPRAVRAVVTIDPPRRSKTKEAAESPTGVVELRGSKKTGSASEIAASLRLGGDLAIAESLRRAGGTILRWARSNRFESVAIDTATLATARRKTSAQDASAALAEGVLLAQYVFANYKREAASKSALPMQVTIVVAGELAAARRRLAEVETIAAGTNLAREIAHEPPNELTPTSLAARAKKLAREAGLTCTVLTERQLNEMKAGAILAVGQGSDAPPRMIVLSYAPRGASKTARPVALVGKAITFDTGGYSLKDKDGILGMKFDKCGGMAVLGAMWAIGKLKPKVPVIGVIAAAENMISGGAYRPDDIIRTLSGKTVEIVSTDAEGRLVLADALTHAQRKFKPRAIIDLATLTGGVVVSLGTVRAGLMSNDDKLVAALTQAGDRVHERLWRLPLDDEYQSLIESPDADMKNSGGRAAHAVLAATFLKQFVDDDQPWAHLDIAGTATTDKDLPYFGKGATGFGVRLVVEYVRSLL